jgi:hypothetical protein
MSSTSHVPRVAVSRPLARRISTRVLAVGFVVVASLALALPAHGPTSWTGVAVCIACYALACRVRFEFGGVFAVPTEPVFVAMWFIVQPRLLLLVVCASLLAAELPDFIRGRTPRDRVAL